MDDLKPGTKWDGAHEGPWVSSLTPEGSHGVLWALRAASFKGSAT